jgi:hypothetical protein
VSGLVRLQVAGATLLLAVMATTLVVYIPAEKPIELGAVWFALTSVVAVFALMARAGSPELRVRRLGRIPVVARLDKGALMAHWRAAPRRIRTWAAACAIAAVVVAAVPGGFFPDGDAQRLDGRYAVVAHGAVVRALTRDEYEQQQMTNLRFFVLGATLVLAGGSVLGSAQLRRP